VFSAFSSDDESLRLIGSKAFTHGEVEAVNVVKRGDTSHLYIQFKGLNNPIRIQMINHITDALTYVNSNRPFNNSSITNGEVESITIRGGIPFLNVKVEGQTQPVQVDFLAYIAQRTGREVETAPFSDTSTGNGTNTGSNTDPDPADPTDPDPDGDAA
jgi:hypothetical protein